MLSTFIVLKSFQVAAEKFLKLDLKVSNYIYEIGL